MKKSYRITFMRKADETEQKLAEDTNVPGYEDGDILDETEFDIEDGCFESMFSDLYELFAEFIDENEFDVVSLSEVREVEYDGDDE